MRSIKLLLAFLCVATMAQAQKKKTTKEVDEMPKSNLSFSTGYSLFNAAGAGSIENTSASGTATYSATPTLQLAYDRMLTKVVSVGAAVSFNHAKGEVKDYEYTDANGNPAVGNLSATVTRTTIGLRALFHYGNKGKLDMYSGLRLGVGLWNADATSTDPNFNPEDINRLRTGVAPQFQFVLFGLRYYVAEGFGLGFETALGSPYMANFNLNYRF